MPYLDQIRLLHMGLQSTDATFPHQHGLPFLGTLLVRSTAFIKSSKDDAHGRAWFEAVLARLDENVRREVAAHLEQHFAPAASAG